MTKWERIDGRHDAKGTLVRAWQAFLAGEEMQHNKTAAQAIIMKAGLKKLGYWPKADK